MHPEKALALISVRLGSSVISAKDVQYWKPYGYYPISVGSGGSVPSVKDVHCRKTLTLGEGRRQRGLAQGHAPVEGEPFYLGEGGR